MAVAPTGVMALPCTVCAPLVGAVTLSAVAYTVQVMTWVSLTLPLATLSVTV